MEIKKQTNSIIGKYNAEELGIINYILGKKEGNRVFTKFELRLINTINLFDKKVVEVCKYIYEREYKEVNV